MRIKYNYEIGDIVHNKKILAKELVAGKRQNYTEYTVECLNCHNIYKTTISRLNSKGKTGTCGKCRGDAARLYKVGDIIGDRLCYAIERDKRGVLLYCFRCIKCGKETKLRDPKLLKDGLACQGCLHRIKWNEKVFESIPDMARQLNLNENSLHAWARLHNNDFSEFTIEWSKQYQLHNKDKRATAKYKVGEIINDYEILEYNREAYLNKEISSPYKVKCIHCGKISYKMAYAIENTSCLCKKIDKSIGKRINVNALKYKAGDIVGDKQILEHVYNPKNGNKSMYKTKCIYCGKVCIEYASQIGKKRCKCQADLASRKYKVGDIIGDFEILDIVGKRKSNGAIIYKAKCKNCGKIHETIAKILSSGYCWKCHRGLRPKTIYDKCKRYEKKRQELLKANNFVESEETNLLKRGKFIYKITNLVNGKLYIGQTSTCVQKRFDDHVRQGLNGSSVTLIDLAIKKYGKDNFKVEIVDSDIKDQEELNLKEQYWIAKYDTCNKKIGYNITIGGNSYGLLKAKRKSPCHTKITYEGVEYSSKQALANAYNLPIKTAIYRLNKYGTLNIPNPWQKFKVCVNGIEYNSLTDFANKFNQPLNAVRKYYRKHKNLAGYFIERFKLTFSKRAISNFKKYVNAEKRLIKKLNNRIVGKPVILNDFKYKVGDIIKGKEILDIKASIALLKAGTPYTKYLYTVKCLKCGHTCTYTTLDTIKENECKFCRDEKYINKIIGPYKFIRKTDKKKSNSYLWECICLNCGRTAYRLPSDIESNIRRGVITGKYCNHCTPTHINILNNEIRKKAAMLSKEAVARQLVGQIAHYKHKGMPRHILLVHNKNTTTQWFCGQWRYKEKTYRKCSTNVWECIAFIISKKIELGIWDIPLASEYLKIAKTIIDMHEVLNKKYNSKQFDTVEKLLSNFNYL